MLPRVTVIAALGAILGGNLGVQAGGGWVAAALISEILIYLVYKSLDADALALPRVQIRRIASIVVSSLVWTAMPVLYWMSGQPALQLVAVVLLATFLIIAHGNSFKSPTATITFGALPAAALILLPTFYGPFAGFQAFSLTASLVLAVFYLGVDVRQNLLHAAALRASQAALAEQTERAITANQAKTSFLAMMSHELRTPMNGVLGMAHALMQTSPSPRQARHIEMLLRSGDGLMTILNDILDISKIEAGKLELESIALDLHELGQRVHDLWSEAASAKGVRLVYDLHPDTPRWVLGDPTRLRQIMINLVSNALKFTSTGEVRLSVRPLSAASDVDEIEIAVSDTGLGISEAQQARLFEAFSQADTSTTRKFGGTGLGLAICKQLATTMGGDISLESRPGEGSTFRVRVALEVTGPASDETLASEAISVCGLRLLVVDDNVINQAVAQSILEAVGATVVTAGDGLDALEALRTDAFDAVLMDVHMPRMDGLEALRHVRRGEAGRADMPVIALTADAMTGVEDELLALGFDAVEPKPINPANLVFAIAKICHGAAASEDVATRSAA